MEKKNFRLNKNERDRQTREQNKTKLTSLMSTHFKCHICKCKIETIEYTQTHTYCRDKVTIVHFYDEIVNGIIKSLRIIIDFSSILLQ